MKNKSSNSRLRAWLDNLPISDAVERPMASLLQVILIGVIIILLIGIILAMVFGPNLSPQEKLTNLIANSIGILVFALPLAMLRYGYFRNSMVIVIVFLLLLSIFLVVAATGLQGANGILFPLTLATILAGVLGNRRTLLLTFVLGAGVLILGAVLEQNTNPQVMFDNIAVVGNFILFNGLMSLVLDRFGITLRVALTDAHMREDELRKEIAERQLAEAKYRDIFENAIHGIFQSTPDGRFVSVNPAMARMYGYASPEDMLRNVTDIPTQLYVDSHGRDRVLSQLANGEQIFGFESLEYRKDGSTLWTSTNIQAIHDVDENILYYEGTVEDITLRKKVEAERENLIQELAAKNAELERFTYTVSHDLKSPLVTINGFLGYLEQDAASGNMDRFRADSERIHEAVNKMRTLLNELLELSRVGRLVNAPERIPFEDLVNSAREILHGQIEATGITIDLEPNLPTVYGDKQRLIEVLQNLLDNAIKFMGKQEKPRIEIGQRGEENDKPVFFVRDNGIGIAREYHERIFGLFNRLDQNIDGTGIGLTIVKRILEFHGGRIWVESEIDKGSTFYFTLLQE